MRLIRVFDLVLAPNNEHLAENSLSLYAKRYGLTAPEILRTMKCGLQLEQAKKPKELQKENAQLWRAVADLTVEKQILKDIA